MRTIHSGIESLAIGVLVLLALCAPDATAAEKPRDRRYVANGLATQEFATIAVLPVVAVVDNEKAEYAVAKGWLNLCSETKALWLKPDEVLARLRQGAGAEAGLDAVAEREIWRTGTVGAETAVRLARALRVDALLAIRIDRWEIVDGGRGTVELTATLTGASGARFWSISGRNEHGRGRTSSEPLYLKDGGMTWFWDRHLNPVPDDDQWLGVALYALLARWSPELPEPLFRTNGTKPMLAGEPDLPGNGR